MKRERKRERSASAQRARARREEEEEETKVIISSSSLEKENGCLLFPLTTGNEKTTRSLGEREEGEEKTN